MIVTLTGLLAWTFMAPVSLPRDGAIFYVHPGISRENLVIELSANKYIRLSPIFDLYAKFRGRIPKSGEYKFAHGSTPYSIWKQIINGTGRYYRSFTIIPGWTFKQVKTAMANQPTLKHLTAEADDESIMLFLGDTEHSPEGMFMPETYYYSRNDTDLVILQRAYDLMKLKLNEEWQTRAANLPYKNPYEALIAASLIEKEAYLPKEQAIIGGVLINRLRKNMLLQFDPTVIYGLGDAYQGKIYKKDLTSDTPYNTYVHKGLTPTPIAMPGLTAIRAALHPDNHEYLYFVAKGDGSHEFTTNLQSHVTAVKKAADVRSKAAVNTQAVTGEPHAAR
jgi:UPF0755 protein